MARGRPMMRLAKEGAKRRLWRATTRHLSELFKIDFSALNICMFHVNIFPYLCI